MSMPVSWIYFENVSSYKGFLLAADGLAGLNQVILTLSVLTLPSSDSEELFFFGERPRVGCFEVVTRTVEVFGRGGRVVGEAVDEAVLFPKTVAIFVRIFLKSPSELRMKFFNLDNSSSGAFLLSFDFAEELLVVLVCIGFSVVVVLFSPLF